MTVTVISEYHELDENGIRLARDPRVCSKKRSTKTRKGRGRRRNLVRSTPRERKKDNKDIHTIEKNRPNSNSRYDPYSTPCPYWYDDDQTPPSLAGPAAALPLVRTLNPDAAPPKVISTEAEADDGGVEEKNAGVCCVPLPPLPLPPLCEYSVPVDAWCMFVLSRLKYRIGERRREVSESRMHQANKGPRT